MDSLVKRTVVVLLVALCAACRAQAGRPLVVDDADPLEQGLFESEAGIAYGRDSGSTHWDIPFGLTYGLVRDVEVGFAFGGQFERRKELSGAEHEDGLADLEIGAKWQFLKSCPLGARHALVPVVKFPTADEKKGLGSGKTDCDLTWVASRAVSGRASAHVNLGYSWIGGSDPDVGHGGMALDYQITEPLQWVGEVFAENELDGGADLLAVCNTGLRWAPVEDLTLDVAVGAKLCGEAPDIIATAGLTWVFGMGD